MIKIKLIKYEEYIEDITSLFNLVFNCSIPEEVWRWKHISNPFNPGDSIIGVAFDDSRIVGATSLMPLELRHGNSIIKAVQSCDSMVHPDYRGKGLFRKILNLSLDYYIKNGFQLLYGVPNAMSSKGIISVGCKEVWQIDNLVSVNRPEKVIAHIVHIDNISQLAGFVYNKMFNKINLAEGFASLINISENYPAILNNLSTLCEDNILDINRSEIFFRWRFDNHPMHKYKYIYLNNDGNVLGYALIGGINHQDGLNIGFIVDCLVRKNDINSYRALVTKAIQELSLEGYDLIQICEMHNMAFRSELIKSFGFKSSLSFPYRYFIKDKHNYYFYVREMTSTIAHDFTIFDPMSWRFSYLFSDTT